MRLLADLFIIAMLLLVTYQDHRYRAVIWLVFPALTVLFSVEAFSSPGFSPEHIVLNAIFLLILLGVLTLYFSLRARRPVNITRAYLGWGDILFLASLCFLFSPLSFLAFYMLSLLGTLVWVLAVYGIRGTKPVTIPLAGIQAFILALVFTAKIFLQFPLNLDNWLLTLYV